MLSMQKSSQRQNKSHSEKEPKKNHIIEQLYVVSEAFKKRMQEKDQSKG